MEWDCRGPWDGMGVFCRREAGGAPGPRGRTHSEVTPHARPCLSSPLRLRGHCDLLPTSIMWQSYGTSRPWWGCHTARVTEQHSRDWDVRGQRWWMSVRTMLCCTRCHLAGWTQGLFAGFELHSLLTEGLPEGGEAMTVGASGRRQCPLVGSQQETGASVLPPWAHEFSQQPEWAWKGILPPSGLQLGTQPVKPQAEEPG